MPCRISSDVHEWSNDIHAVFSLNPVNLPASEQSGKLVWEKKTPWSFTAACGCRLVLDT